MLLHALLFRITAVFFPVALICTTYLYLYPAFHNCDFPQSTLESKDNNDIVILRRLSSVFQSRYYKPPGLAPFRLLALADPQLEGDTSLPDPPNYQFRGRKEFLQFLRQLRWAELRTEIKYGWLDLKVGLVRGFRYLRKSLDLLGNDLYLAHVHRTMHWWSQPTHVTVLGDLLGSQWIGKEEFENRSGRFWTRVFRGAEIVEPERLGVIDGKFQVPWIELLGEDSAWNKRLLNVAGNHDVGYAGDMDEDRLDRFERAFGPANGYLRFVLSDPYQRYGKETPFLDIVMLNSMNLDSPAYAKDLQSRTHDFVNEAISYASPVEQQHHATILLTHIPLHKEAGICVDSPYFTYFPGLNGYGVREQNMISEDMSRDALLQGIFGKSSNPEAPARGMGRNGLILTGHDHEGCSVLHYADRESQTWKAARFDSSEAQDALREEDVPALREVTVRSMMGDFGGNAALVSAWWDENQARWQFAVSNCSLGVQHIWWAIHILDLITAVLLLLSLVSYLTGLPTKQAIVVDKANGRIKSVKTVKVANGSIEASKPGTRSPGQRNKRKRARKKQ